MRASRLRRRVLQGFRASHRLRRPYARLTQEWGDHCENESERSTSKWRNEAYEA